MRLNASEQALARSRPRHGVRPASFRHVQSPRLSKLVADDQNARSAASSGRASPISMCGDVTELRPPLVSECGDASMMPLFHRCSSEWLPARRVTN